MSQIGLLFSINADITKEVTELIFEPCYKFIQKQASKIYKEHIRITKSKDGYCYLQLPKHKVLLEENVNTRQTHILTSCFPVLELSEEVDKLDQFISQSKLDVRYIQMWLSLCCDKDIPFPAIKYLPYTLRTLLKITEDIEYIIPEGREGEWKKAERILNYYLGLKLLL